MAGEGGARSSAALTGFLTPLRGKLLQAWIEKDVFMWLSSGQKAGTSLLFTLTRVAPLRL